MAVELETPRLRLRGHRPDDLDAYAAMWSHPEVVRYIGGTPFSREQAWTRLLRNVGLWQLIGYGLWAVEDRATGAFLGEVGFHDLKRQLEPSLDGLLEFGIAFVPTAQGRGIGTEAGRAAIAWANAAFPERRQVCIVEPVNEPSVALVGKLGFRLLERSFYHGTPILVMERPRLKGANDAAGR